MNSFQVYFSVIRKRSSKDKVLFSINPIGGRCIYKILLLQPVYVTTLNLHT